MISNNSHSESLRIFNIVYDKYGTMLYSLALEICKCPDKAEKTVTQTFGKALNENILTENGSSLCSSLIKILIKKSFENLNDYEKKNTVILN
jgi:hypothetical protein